MKRPIPRNRVCPARWPLAVALAAAPRAAPAAPEVWITLGQKEAAHLRESLARAGRADVLQVEADGEVVVARIREDRIPLLSQIIHDELHRCGGFAAHASREAAFQARRARAVARPPEPLVDYTIDNGPVVQALMAGVQEANVREHDHLAGRLLHALPQRRRPGRQSANWIRNLWAGLRAPGRPDVTVQLFTHPTATRPAAVRDPDHPGHHAAGRGRGAGRAPGLDQRQRCHQPRAGRRRRRLRRRQPLRGHPRGHGATATGRSAR